MKKFISFLLIVMMALSLCSCGLLGGGVKELSLKQDGKKIKDFEDAEKWIEDYEERYEDWLDEGELRKGQWYSISGQSTEEFSYDDIEGKQTSKITGKYYYSPYQFESKLSLKIKTTSEYTEDDEKFEETSTTTVIFVEGAWYVKTEVKESSEDGKASEVEYDSTPYSMPYFSIIENPLVVFNMLGFDIEDGELYLSDDTIEYACEDGDDLEQCIVKLDKDGISLKSLQIYSHSEYDMDGDESISSFKITIKKAMSGSAKRPKDYYKYN